MDLTFATWNVRTMLQPGKMVEVAEQIIKYNIDVVALQEIRWSGSGRIDKKEYSMLYSGPNIRSGKNGTGFIITKKIRKSLLLFEPINERICKIRVKGRFRNVTLVSVYAPTEEADEDIKLDFYQELERVYYAIPKYDTKIILGDLNAQIGVESFAQTVAGRFSLHNETNENGKYLCQFAEASDMVIKSTFFQRKNIHKGTWKAPNGAVTQIDHVLIDRCHASSIIDVKTARGPNCESDHFVVKVKFRERLVCVGSGNRHCTKKWNLEKFKDEDTMERFIESVSAKVIRNLREVGICEVEERWNKIKKAVEESAKEVIGEKRKQRNEEWFDGECAEALKIRNEKRLAALQRSTRQNTTAYNESRRRTKKILRKKKRDFLKRKIEQIEELKASNETRKFYGAVRYMNHGFQPKVDVCKDKNGKIVEKSNIINRWEEHFNDMLSVRKVNSDLSPELENLNDLEPLSIEEVVESIGKLKNNKSPGEDLLIAEFFKKGGEELTNQMYLLMEDIWDKEYMPADWKTSLIYPIHKKGDKLCCENYRGISLLGVAYKIFSNILVSRLNGFAENILQEYQCGFRKGRGTTDQIFVMRQLMEKCREYKTDLHVLFIDYRRAFDSVIRSSMISALRDFNIPNKLIRLIKVSMDGSNAKVYINGSLSRSFPVTAGVRQGDALSATLFNLALHSVIKKLNASGNIMHASIQICAYADDICLVARNKRSLMDIFKLLKVEGEVVGLEVNEAKTKYMYVGTSSNEIVKEDLNVEGFCFENVKSFTYLGTELNCRNEISAEIQKRIMAGNRAYYANLKLFRSSLLSRVTKVSLYKTLVRPIVTYAAETWTLGTPTINALKIFERRILRKIYGPVVEDGEWRIRKNRELYELYGSCDIVRFIRARRMEWLGHLARMEDGRMPKKILHGTFYGTRRRGRPRRRWIQDVEKDLAALGVAKNWRTKALSREDWCNVVREAKAHPGL